MTATQLSPVETSVLIVGAGPTGLLLAAELHRRNVPTHLIDALPAPLHWDRATVVHPRSLQIFEAMGIVDEFLKVGCKQKTIRLYSAGASLGTIDLGICGSVYGYNIGVSEEVTERILGTQLQKFGGEVHRGSKLVGLEAHDGGVRATIEHDGATYPVAARWVVGCDGIHSPTRDLSGIGFEGHDIEKPWAVFDTSLANWPHTHEANFGYLDELPVIMTALPGRRWRVYLRPTSPDSDLVADAASILNRYEPGVQFVDVENPGRFYCHTKIATHFRSGPVFVAGDAAHLCSPAEGHGMNCGLQDAFNLAWKLALVHHGAAEPALLDSYEVERRPVAATITVSGDNTEHAQTLLDPTDRQKRDAAIRAMLADANALHNDVVAKTELCIEYSGSPVVFGDANPRLAAGHRLPDTLEVSDARGTVAKLHAQGHRAGHTLMLIGGASADAQTFADLQAALDKFAGDAPLFESAVAFSAGSTSPQNVGRIGAAEAGLLGIDGITLFAIRPDGYIGLRADRDHRAALERYRDVVRTGRKATLQNSQPPPNRPSQAL
jgi:2-polyprenyl-6-methoxyphenol hydroxylase-like FAD-dependent oxidoreductase